MGYEHDLEYFVCSLMQIGGYLNPNTFVKPENVNAKGFVNVSNLDGNRINMYDNEEFINASWSMDRGFSVIRVEVVINPCEYNKPGIRQVHKIDRVYKRTIYINIYEEHRVSGVMIPLYGISIKFDEWGFLKCIRVINSSYEHETLLSYIRELQELGTSSTKMIAHEIYCVISMWTREKSRRITKYEKIGPVTTIKYRRLHDVYTRKQM